MLNVMSTAHSTGPLNVVYTVHSTGPLNAVSTVHSTGPLNVVSTAHSTWPLNVVSTAHYRTAQCRVHSTLYRTAQCRVHSTLCKTTQCRVHSTLQDRSMSCPQHTTGPYLEPRECSPHPYYLFLQDPFLCCSFIYAYVFPVDVFRPTFCSFLVFHLPTYQKRSGPAVSEYSVRLSSFGSDFNDSCLPKAVACFYLSRSPSVLTEIFLSCCIHMTTEYLKLGLDGLVSHRV
jgi:hypothetical protein